MVFVVVAYMYVCLFLSFFVYVVSSALFLALAAASPAVVAFAACILGLIGWLFFCASLFRFYGTCCVKQLTFGLDDKQQR